MSRANHRRAKVAGRSLALYGEQTNCHGAEAVTDLIADIGHYCDADELNFVGLVGRGIGHWRADLTDPDGSGRLPEVTILIDGGEP